MSTSPSSLFKTPSPPSPELFKVSPEDFKHIHPTRNPKKKTSKNRLNTPLLFTPRAITNDHFTNISIRSFHLTTTYSQSSSQDTTTTNNEDPITPFSNPSFFSRTFNSTSPSSLEHNTLIRKQHSTTIPSISKFSFIPNEVSNLSYDDIKSFWSYTYDCINNIELLPHGDSYEIVSQLKSIHVNVENGYGEKIVVFDLDETLIHSMKDIELCDKIVKVNVNCMFNGNNNAKYVLLGVNIRPGLKMLFNKLKDKYKLVVFTSGFQKYAEPIIDLIDPYKEIFCMRLYRHHCVKVMLNDEICYIKDLRIFKNVDLGNIVLVDNSLMSFCYQIDNGIPVIPFYDNVNDNEMEYLSDFLLQIWEDGNTNDIRKSIKRHIRNLYKRHVTDMELFKGEHDNNDYNDIIKSQTAYFDIVNAE